MAQLRSELKEGTILESLSYKHVREVLFAVKTRECLWNPANESYNREGCRNASFLFAEHDLRTKGYPDVDIKKLWEELKLEYFSEVVRSKLRGPTEAQVPEKEFFMDVMNFMENTHMSVLDEYELKRKEPKGKTWGSPPPTGILATVNAPTCASHESSTSAEDSTDPKEKGQQAASVPPMRNHDEEVIKKLERATEQLRSLRFLGGEGFLAAAAQNEPEPNVADQLKPTAPPTNLPANRVQSTSEKSRKEVLIALYSYESRSGDDVSFTKGDQMDLLLSYNSDWWYIRHQKTGKTGFVPSNFVVKKQTVETEKWFAGNISCFEAERLISASNLPKGTFVVREIGNAERELALLVRDSAGCSVKRYKIQRLGNEQGFFITARKPFGTLQELIEYYSEVTDGMCCLLTLPALSKPIIKPGEVSSEAEPNWEIPHNQVQLKNKIGDGYFGEVWSGQWRGIVDLTVKMRNSHKMSVEEFLQEAQIMNQLNHPNIVKLYAVCTKKSPFYLLTEFMKNGTLLKYLKIQGTNLGTQALVDMAIQIANGMIYLGQQKVVHRDLAARNVFVGDEENGVPFVKVGDFGLARKLVGESEYVVVGSLLPDQCLKWSAPEAIKNCKFSVKSDVWSYGILLFEILTKGQEPYSEIDYQVLSRICFGDYRLPMPHGFPEHIYHEVMLKCWDKNPDKRPTFEEIIEILNKQEI